MSSIEEIADMMEEMMSRNKMMDAFQRSGKGEIFILKYLYSKNTSVSPTELSEALGSSASRISAALGSLEKKGAIHREIDTANRRNILVTITDTGREQIYNSIKQMRGHLIQVLTEMGEEKANDFFRLNKEFFEIAGRTMPDISSCEN